MNRLVWLTMPMVFLVFLFGCPSTPPSSSSLPKATPTVAPAATPVPEAKTPVEEKNVPNILTDEDLKAAKEAIAAAERAQAAEFSPNLLAKAKKAFGDAKDLGSTDANQAKVLLAQAETDAKTARDEAYAARKAVYLSRLDRAGQMLLDIEADKYNPDSYAAADTKRKAAVAAFDKDFDAGAEASEDALKSLVGLYDSLSAQLQKVLNAQKNAKNSLDDAEKADAFVWVPDLLQTANDSFFKGQTSYKKKNLDEALANWIQADFQAKEAATKALKQKQKLESQELMQATMKKLEKASKATVVGPDDSIQEGSNWDGNSELKKLQDKAVQTPDVPATSDDSKVQPVTPTPATPDVSKPLSMKLPSDGTTAVLGEKSRITYLDQAKQAWEDGVNAFNKEDYALANQYFLDSQRLTDLYLSMAVNSIYTVRLIPDRRDSLWRISEYGDIYGDPYEWPRIWSRNKKLIQNPDLIYPGWKLIIPPQ